MSSEQQVDQLILAKLEEHYAAAGEPTEIDEAFAHRYFADVAATSQDSSESPEVQGPHKTDADFVKASWTLVDVKIAEKGLKFVAADVEATGNYWGTSQTFGAIEVGKPYTYEVGVIKKYLLWIQIKQEGSLWKRVVYVGPNLSGIQASKGKGVWQKL